MSPTSMPVLPDPNQLVPASFPAGPRVLCDASDLDRVRGWRGSVEWIDLSIERLLANAKAPPADSNPEVLEPENGIKLATTLINLAEQNALAFSLVAQPRYREQALAALGAMASLYTRIQAGPKEGRMSRQGLRESSLGVEVARAYDLLRASGLSESESQPGRAMLVDWFASLKKQGHRTCGNHHTWGLAAMMAIGSALGDRTMLHEVFYGYDCGEEIIDIDLPPRAYGLVHQLGHEFFDDGCHWERTIGYHMYTLMAFTQIAMNAANLGIDLWHRPFPALACSDGFDLHRAYGGQPRILKMMFESTLYRAMVGGEMSVLHDSGLVNLRGLGIWGIVYEAAFDAYGDSRFAWVLNHMEREHPKREFPGLRMSLQTNRGDMDFVRVRTRVLPDGSSPFPVDARIGGAGTHINGCTLLPVAGEAILRSDPHDPLSPGATIFFGPHNAGHQSPAALHVDVFHCGRGVAIAPRAGEGGYGNPLMGTWIRTTLAHNTVTVDRRPMFPYDFANPSIWEADHWRGRVSDGSLHFFEAARDYSVVRAANQNVYPGTLLDRTLVLTREWLLDVVRVISDEAHDYDLPIHGVGEVTSDHQTEALNNPAWTEAPGYRHLLNPRRVVLPGSETELTWDDGRGRTTVQALLPAGGQVALAGVRDAVPELGDAKVDSVRRTSAILSFTGKSGHFVSLWRFGGLPARVAGIVNREMRAIEVQIARGSATEAWRLPFQKEPVRRLR